ncbi:putative glucose-methanol-choline oxidoreductase [Aspergillus steynii IBT 23096]|uniref:Putative glucose-methanol-choline oxidoreductase n=1 Tax=Aspergillus steynii IBT 23096 TaxID=1392250 RepID=A0A2I2FUV6_9EURO|nr:putative glucose-methanol-choline oxidoreductase [Aspergillus steynii IBT 23096]PLB44423.1 putative glucose-methanol-choline oxidoreductase [Aspergillus steynii IBT 23096]
MTAKAALLALLAAFAQASPPFGSSFGVPGTNATYDYVVVGGGNAGLTLATRLVQQSAGTVAVIEAGSFYEISNGNFSQVPAFTGASSGRELSDWHPLIDWGYATTPQAGAYNLSIHYARGKTLGGSSARNSMVYQRGTVGTHERWADKVGDDSYRWENFHPYFKKSVNLTRPNMHLRFQNSTPVYDALAASDGNGPLSISYPNYAQAFTTWSIPGFAQIGIPEIPGFLSGEIIGHSYSTLTINGTTMTRDSSETSFLREGLKNPNLIVYPMAMAKRILFTEEKAASGVVVEVQGLEYVLSARKEVLVCAGAFGSPQLLMVSGVGPAEVLKSFDIPIIADRPGVGQGMQDHVVYDIGYQVNVPTMSSLMNPAFGAKHIQLFNEHAAGMLTGSNTEALAMEKIPESLRATWSNKTRDQLNAYPADWPEVEYITVPLNPANSIAEPGIDYGSLGIVLVAPESRGTLTISSADTNVAPIIDPNYFDEPSDMDILVAGFKRARQFFDTEALRTIVIGEERFPGKNVSTDAQIADFIRKNIHTIWHASCTCAMGKVTDPMAVVDAQARVIGVQKLRVVDSSSFALLPPGHPMSTVYALAEKIACDISGHC